MTGIYTSQHQGGRWVHEGRRSRVENPVSPEPLRDVLLGGKHPVTSW